MKGIMGNRMKKIIIENLEGMNDDAGQRRRGGIAAAAAASFLTAAQWKLVPDYNALEPVAPPRPNPNPNPQYRLSQ